MRASQTIGRGGDADALAPSRTDGEVFSPRRCLQLAACQLSTLNSQRFTTLHRELRLDFAFILLHLGSGFVLPLDSASRRGCVPSPSPDESGRPPLAGQLVVFTGKLSSLGRKDARALVTRLGGATAHDVNAKTTMLVVCAEGVGPTPYADETPDSV